MNNIKRLSSLYSLSLSVLLLQSYAMPVLPKSSGIQHLTPVHVEGLRVIRLFNSSATSIYQLANKLKFKKSIENLSAEYGGGAKDKIITYSLSGDTIQYYVSQGRKTLLYCKFDKPQIYINSIKFLSLNKSELVVPKFQKYNDIVFEDQGAFEEVELRFSSNRISKLKYTFHPD